MRGINLMMAAVIGLLLLSCSEEVTDEMANYQAAFDAANVKWTTAGIEDYEYQLYRSVEHSFFLMRISVTDDEMTNVRDEVSDGEIDVDHTFATTINGLFDYINTLFFTMKNNSQVEIEDLKIYYNTQYGYPAEVHYKVTDESQDMVRVDVHLKAANLEAVDG